MKKKYTTVASIFGKKWNLPLSSQLSVDTDLVPDKSGCFLSKHQTNPCEGGLSPAEQLCTGKAGGADGPPQRAP